MSELPWFRCYPDPLLAVLGGLSATEQLVFFHAVLAHFRRSGIYSGGQDQHIRADASVVARRCHISKGAAAKAMDELEAAGLITITDDFRIVPDVPWSEDIPSRTALPPSVRAEVFERDGMICAYCGTTEAPFEIDHILAVALGGSDNPTNLTVSCRSCNRRKRAKTLEEWLA